MQEITLPAYGKINIGLDVTGTRADGYHLVRMVMQQVELSDTLTLIKKDAPGITMKCDDPSLPTDDSNLCVKAAKILLEEFAPNQGLEIILNKRLPVAAGMAGGSTDAAAVFCGLNKLLDLGLTPEQLMQRAITIGADIPYCIMGGTALAEGIGEELTALASLPQWPVLIAKPEIMVSTKAVYNELDSLQNPMHPPMDALIDAIAADASIKSIAPHMGNILEGVTIKGHPIIEKIKETMLDNGATIALMSGSGPTVFGIFETEVDLARAKAAVEAAGDAAYIRSTRLRRKHD